ncbi:hypothetical protein [Halopiger djelfimassiliensis]|uniref:hypothetical protein n=1 Tax=Halopiger djelfimassiliensis TaxID=1293047 RepID=UPI0006778C1B|nr:hypothetical protein [Halopiger djelfimassiliensis]
MSANGADDGDEVPGREIAYRLFAAEYDDASLSYAESDEERAPNYVVSPTGARVNRLFAVGTLTEVSPVNDEMVRARVVDPTGAFVVYAGQYQPDELAFLEGIEPPAFVAVTGKARTFQPDDGDRVYTSIRPESIATVDADTRDRWVVSAAERTLERIGTYAAAAGDGASTDALSEAGVDPALAAGIPLAREHYGTTPSYLAALRDCAVEAVEVVAGDRDQVSGLEIGPDGSSSEYGTATFDSLADLGGPDLGGMNADSGTEPAETEPVAATAADEPDGEAETVATSSAAGTATTTEHESDTAVDIDSATAADSTLEDESGEPTRGGDGDEAAAEYDESNVDDTTSGIEGDGDPGAFDAGDGDGDLGDFDAGNQMYEMDDEERQQLEEEFGAEFTTGTEVDSPGESDLDVPDPADADDPGTPPEPGLESDSAPADAGEATDLEEEPTDDTADETDSADEAAADAEGSDDETDEDGGDGTDADDVDLQTYVVETMDDLDAGDGADRAELIDAVIDETGAAEDDVEDAIQDALMGGQCYEPDDETLKPI